MTPRVGSWLCLLVLLFTSPVFSAPAHTVTGTVMNSDGVPLEGVTITAFTPETGEEKSARFRSADPERKALATTRSDRAGKFSLSLSSVAVIDLMFASKGHAPFVRRISPGEEVGGIVLTRGRTIRGRVTGAGKPLANMPVLLLIRDGDVLERTDENGRFIMSAPGPRDGGTFLLFHPDFAPLERPLTEPAAESSLDLALRPGVAISGMVVAEDGKAPVGGVEVDVDRVRSTKSAEDGTFTIRNAPVNWKSVRARREGKMGFASRGAEKLLLRMTRGVTVTAQVRDAKTQKPLPFAAVSLSQDRGESEAVAFTDAKGVATATGFAPGSYTMFVRHPLFMPQQMLVSLAPGESASRMFSLPPLATVTGTVVGEDKKPVAAARLRASIVPRMGRRSTFGLDASSYTTPDGRFVFRGMAIDDVSELVASKKGYPSASAGRLKLAAGERKSNVVIVMPAGIEVTGKVIDAEDRPVGGARIIVRETQQTMRPGFVTNDELPLTSSDGRFTLRVKEGDHDFSFLADGFARNVMKQIRVTPKMEPLIVKMAPAVELSGRVVLPDRKGVEGVDVSISEDEFSTSSAVTAADGSFVLRDLSPGTRMLAAYSQEQMIFEFRQVVVPGNDLEIRLEGRTTLRGRVFDAETKNAITDFRIGASGEKVSSQMNAFGPDMMRAIHSDDGSFVLENVPVGSAQIIAEAPGYVRTTLSGLEVRSDKPMDDVVVALQRGVRVTGKVTGPDGLSLQDVAVRSEEASSQFRLNRQMQSLPSSTDANGEYVLDGQRPAELTIAFEKEGFVPEKKTVKLSGREARVDATLSRGRTIRVSVISEQGSPVADAMVWVTTPGRNIRETTDPAGSIELSGLAPGRYSFVAQKSGLARAELKDVELESITAPLQLVMKAGGTIRGRIIGIKPDEVTEAFVLVEDASRSSNRAPVNAAGEFRAEGVAPGQARVRAVVGGMGKNRTTLPKTVEVVAGSDVQTELEFANEASLRGRVTRNGEVVTSAEVSLFAREATIMSRGSASTDSSGNYEIQGLQNGRYDVLVTDMSKMIEYGTTFNVNGASTFHIDIAGATVRGSVVDAETGAPITGATVQIDRQRGEQAQVWIGRRELSTGPSGNFHAESLGHGSYRVTATKDGYAHAHSDFSLRDGESRDVELKMTKSGSTTVRVVDGRTGSPIIANVRLFDVKGESLFDVAGRSPDGVVRLPLAAGSYRYRVMAPNYAGASGVLVAPATDFRIALMPGGRLTIEVTSAEPIAMRMVGSDGVPYPLPARTRGDNDTFGLLPGVNSFDNVTPGTYRLEVLDPRGAVAKTHSVTVIEGQAAVVRVGT